VVAFRDITERRLFEKELMWQANHDPLTRLHNRYHFEHQLNYEVSRLRRSVETSALLYIDLDRFKYINDTAGHAAGDQLLVGVAAQLQSRLRSADLLARLGGDEFAVILRSVEPQAAMTAAQGFREVLEQYDFVHGARSYKVNASIGVALLNQETASPGEALANADIACHIAKNRGRNQAHRYEPESDAKVAMTLELGWSTRLQDALKNDHFVLHYQPIVPAGATPLADPHYEVLVRYVDARGEVVYPCAFLPTAERFGMMPQVDRWVLTHAIEKLAALRAAGHAATFTVNISGQTLDADQLVPLLTGLVREHALDPRTLILEITETSAIANIDAAKRLIDDMRALGCRFALDDFGSGFSSFHHLKHLPVDFVKIDGQFVRGMVENSADRAIVASINQIAHSFGKRTVAEYVESREILEMLTGYGVDYVQGFYISRPQSEIAIAAGSARSTQPGASRLRA
jgi:diguanylate cyclase (GGDEF)-like protein